MLVDIFTARKPSTKNVKTYQCLLKECSGNFPVNKKWERFVTGIRQISNAQSCRLQSWIENANKGGNLGRGRPTVLLDQVPYYKTDRCSGNTTRPWYSNRAPWNPGDIQGFREAISFIIQIINIILIILIAFISFLRPESAS